MRARREVAIVFHCRCFLFLQFSYNPCLIMLCVGGSEVEIHGSYFRLHLTSRKM